MVRGREGVGGQVVMLAGKRAAACLPGGLLDAARSHCRRLLLDSPSSKVRFLPYAALHDLLSCLLPAPPTFVATGSEVSRRLNWDAKIALSDRNADHVSVDGRLLDWEVLKERGMLAWWTVSSRGKSVRSNGGRFVDRISY